MIKSREESNHFTPLLLSSIPKGLEFRAEMIRELKGAFMDWLIIVILIGLIIVFRLVPAPSNIQYFRINDPELK